MGRLSTSFFTQTRMSSQKTSYSQIWIGNFSGQSGWCYGSVSTQIHVSRPELVFQVPHGIQQLMSSESMPVLSSAITLFELFMSEWESLHEKFPRLTPWINVGLTWAKKYYKIMDDTDAYIVTMGELFFIPFQYTLTVDHRL